jgi:DNA-binding GntR family transcriptional regulator
MDDAAAQQADQWEQLDRQVPLSEQAYRTIREAIAVGQLAPGQKITERSLAVLLGVSPTPIREALRRLEQEQLIARMGPKTLTVAEHSASSLEELEYAETTLRAALAKFAAAKASDRDIAKLRGIVHRLVGAIDGHPETLLSIAAEFDQAVVEIADSPVAGMLASAEVFGRERRLASVRAMQTSRRDIGARHLNAHGALVDAIAEHDPGRAESIVREHLASTTALLLTDLDAKEEA